MPLVLFTAFRQCLYSDILPELYCLFPESISALTINSFKHLQFRKHPRKTNANSQQQRHSFSFSQNYKLACTLRERNPPPPSMYV